MTCVHCEDLVVDDIENTGFQPVDLAHIGLQRGDLSVEILFKIYNAVVLNVSAVDLFVDGIVPDIMKGDFDIICTYSRAAGKWQIGSVQYETVGDTV